MELLVQRETATQHSTPGTLTGLGDGATYESLEPPPIPDPQYPGAPKRIPSGRYQVQMYESPRFTQLLGRPTNVPLLQSVPNFSGIEIHYGNTTVDDSRGVPVFLTEGCLLVGMSRANADYILRTIEACTQHVWPAIQKACDSGEQVWITYQDATVVSDQELGQ